MMINSLAGVFLYVRRTSKVKGAPWEEGRKFGVVIHGLRTERRRQERPLLGWLMAVPLEIMLVPFG